MSKKLEVPEIKTGQDQNDESFTFELQYVTFKLDEQSYGVNVDAALEVIRMVALTESPESPDHVVGVINLRGQVVPIVDLRKRLGLKAGVYTLVTPILIVTIKDWTVGLIVDKVSEVITIAPSLIEKSAETFSGSQCVAGVAKLDHGLVFLLDLGYVFSADESKVMQEVIDTRIDDKVLA